MTSLFKRKLYDRMMAWKNRTRGKRALLIEGARKVGKTTLVKSFADNEYSSAVYIDFAEPEPGAIELFEHYCSDIPALLSSLASLQGVQLKERDTVFVLDEIQSYPRARQLIKYFVLDGRFDFIETGTPISLRVNTRDIQMPSEEESVEMHPLDFEEWLWANGDSVTFPFLRSRFEARQPLEPPLHNAMMRKYKAYMLVGGMPQAVAEYVGTKDLGRCEEAKKSMIEAYRREMTCIPVNVGSKARMVFDKIPSNLSRRSKAFSPGLVTEGSKTFQYDRSLAWLKESRIVNMCVGSDMSGGGEGRFKCYLLDTGLLMTLASGEGLSTPSEVQLSFIRGKLSMNEGMLFENMVAQELAARHTALRFAEFYDKADDKHIHEVDFILPRGGKIVAIEVKSGVSSRHRSLDLFIERYRKRIDSVFVIHSGDLKVDGDVVYIPIYMSMFL